MTTTTCNMNEVKVHEKIFKPFISKEQIAIRIAEIGQQINNDYAGKQPLFLSILNGSFIFAADLFRTITVDAQISFIKLVSYHGTDSTGTVVTSIGLEEELKDRDVIILEDIVDTGNTMSVFIPEVLKRNPASLRIATLLTKPSALRHPIKVDYVGFEIPDKFVVGFGLDYNGRGRELPEIYQLA